MIIIFFLEDDVDVRAAVDIHRGCLTAPGAYSYAKILELQYYMYLKAQESSSIFASSTHTWIDLISYT